MWSFLSKGYKIRGSSISHTSIFFSLQSSLQTWELKKVAQAALHFKDALDVLVPSSNPDYCLKTIWVDNPSTPTAHKTPRMGVKMLGNLSDSLSRTELIKYLQPTGDTDFDWNFVTFLTSDAKEIEFRRPPASKTSKEVLGWAELTMTLGLAALKCGSTEELQAQGDTVSGLREFLAGANVEGITEPERMHRL